MLIEVKPAAETPDDARWAVFIGGVVFGVSKSSCDCDYVAERLAGMFEERPEVRHYSEERNALMAKLAEIKRRQKGAT